MGASSVAARPASAWSPFAHRVFAVMWTAMLVSNIGTWVRDVGAGWLMTSLSPSAVMVALVQVAGTLPVFLLALPAGTLADLVDRRRLLLAVNVALMGVGLVLGVLTHADLMTPWLLVGGLFIAGIGSALMGPVLQSLTPLQVPRPELRAAIALNSMGFNVARAIGPALGGLILAAVSVAATFFVDAASYLVAACALMWWKGAAERASPGAPEPFLGAMRTGLRFARHAPELRRTLLRAASFFVFASAYWALLPLIARRELGGDASLYGLLLASVGAGAVGGAIALPRLRQRIDAEATLRAGVALTVVALGVLATAKAAWLAVMALLLSGASWIAVLTTANTAAQTVLPNWVRGRGLAVYLTVFYGAMTLGGLLWGGLADATSVRTALWSAAALGAVSLALAWWRPLPDAEPDVTPSLHWPEPALHVGAGAEDGPVLIAIDYEVAAGDRQDFLTALAMLSAERRRNGALRWDVFEDAERLGRFTELFLEPSWAEHIRHHARVTRADADVQAAVQRFHRGVAPPVVRHLLLRHS